MRGRRFSVINKTRKICLASEAEMPRSTYGRMQGLIGRSFQSFSPGMGLWIIPSMGIHTFGMRFPIDVVYLDSQTQILRLYHRLAPFRFGAPMIRARSVLELPAGVLEQTHTEVGDVLEFRPCSTASGGKGL
jgi:uncharacterized protein